MTPIKRNLVTLGVFVGIVAMPIGSAYGQTCKTNIALEDPATRHVCATWDELGDPVLQQDFTVTYVCPFGACSDAPRVEFIQGGVNEAIAWEIYSEVLDAQGNPTGPANLGDVVLADDVDPNEGKFTVSITKSGGFGAANVSSIVLDSSDLLWTGHSTLTSAGSFTRISGNVTGDIVAIAAGSAGGQADGTTIIYGNVQGTLTIPRVSGTLDIRGELSCGSVTTINSGGFLYIGSLTGPEVCPAPIGNHTLQVTEALAGLLQFTGQNVHGAFINIADFEGSGQLRMIGSPTYPEINLYNGVDSADASIYIAYHGGKLYLHDKDMLGVMDFPVFDELGGVLDGGVLKGSVRCGWHPTTGQKENRGTIEFASVAAGGEIIADVQVEFQGTIDIAGAMAGLIKIENDLEEDEFGTGGEILIDGDLSGWV